MAKHNFSDEDLSRWKHEINPAPIFSKRIKLSREGSEFVGCCPDVYHKKNVGHSDKNPSLKIWKLDDGTWGFKCFSCGASGNVFQFVQNFDNVSFPTAVRKVLAEAGVSGWQDGEEQEAPPELDQEKKIYTTFQMSQYSPAIFELEQSKSAQGWLAARGISMQTARKFCVGFVQSAEKITSTNEWVNDGWILFPTVSADRHTVTSVKYRSLMAKKVKKAGKNNSGILRAPNTSTTLFNFQTVVPGEDVWVVEGEPDTLVMAQSGFTTVGYPMAEYKPTDDEIEVLSSAKRRFLAGDRDQVGIKAMKALHDNLSGATYVIEWPNNRKDANDVLTHECGNDPEKFKALVEDLKQRAIQTETIPILRNGADIAPRRIRWLWDGKIPIGKMTLFAGNPDNGKSLAATSVASICTRGDNFPECNFAIAPSDVLMLLGEDDLEDTAVPRLMAAGANMKRIHFLESVRPVKQEDREVKLDMDIPAIEKQLEDNPNIRLLIIDPISNYLGDVSMVAEQEVRSILIPLKRAVEKFNVALVVVMHLNKKNDMDAIGRVGGAMAFIGVARCSWLFARNPKEEPKEGEEASTDTRPDTFSMLRIKNNLVSAGRAGLSYSVDTKHIPVNGEPDMVAPFIQWGGVIEGSADDALDRRGRGRQDDNAPARSVGRPDDKLQAAVRWLENELQDNQPHVSKVLVADAKEGGGIAPDTLRKAKAALKVRDFKAGTPAKWYWQMDPMDETGETDADDSKSDPSMFDHVRIEGVE